MSSPSTAASQAASAWPSRIRGTGRSPARRLLPALVLITLAQLSTNAAPAFASDDREVLLKEADGALHTRDYATAAALYARAAALDSTSGDAPLMAAVAEFQLGQYQAARADLGRASARRLSAADRNLVRTYRDLLAEVTATSPPEADADQFAATVVTSVGGGYDSNTNRSGGAQLASDAAAGKSLGGGFASGTLELGVAGPTAHGIDLGLEYTLDQNAQLDRAMADLDYQDHTLELALRRTLAEGARLDVTLAGELSFMGVATALHPFSSSARADVDLALGAGTLRLRVGGSYQATQVQDVQLTFLSGQRLEVRATPSLDLFGWRASASVRMRAEMLDSAHSDVGVSDDPACAACSAGTTIPYSNRSASLAVRLRAPIAWWLRPGAWIRMDGRSYDGMASFERSEGGRVTSRTDLGQRASTTRAIGADLRLKVTETIALTARWEFSHFAGVFRPASAAACSGHDECGQGALADRDYSRHRLGLQLEIGWL
jgi:hypothetical protein